ELFRRLLTLAETDEGLPLKKDRVELATMAGELARLYAPTADRRRIHLITEAHGRPAVDGDENLLRQAAANLVENAIRYSPRRRPSIRRPAAQPSSRAAAHAVGETLVPVTPPTRLDVRVSWLEGERA